MKCYFIKAVKKDGDTIANYWNTSKKKALREYQKDHGTNCVVKEIWRLA